MHTQISFLPFTNPIESMKFFIVLIAFLYLFSRIASEIVLPQGRVRGRKCSTHDDVIEYYGIPFALPPIGSLRFRPPLPYNISYENGTLDATSFPKVCSQASMTDVMTLDSSEDCLFLNIWAPDNTSTSLPVRVYIHGGGFTAGNASNTAFNGCNSVAATKTLQVNVQYRLGPFGFLAHEATWRESNTTGNWGLLDQQAALKWVQANIAAFGGDPQRVLLFGESAGAHSVGYHLVMPSSAGLFHSAISQSGPPLPLKTKEQAYNSTRSYISNLNCDWSSKPELQLKCLREKSAYDLLAAVTLGDFLISNLPAYQNFWPVVDEVHILMQPIQSIENGYFNKVPYMMGTNRDEGESFVNLVETNASIGDIYDFIGSVFPNSDSGAIISLYDIDTLPDDSVSIMSTLSELWTDIFMKCPTQRTLWGAHKNNVPVFQYFWEHIPSCPTYSGWSDFNGAIHFSEVSFVFGQVPCKLKDNEISISHLFLLAWSEMAANGQPLLPSLEPWPLWNAELMQTVSLRNYYSVGKKDFSTKCNAIDAAFGMTPVFTTNKMADVMTK